jgi:hypothetical protein
VVNLIELILQGLSIAAAIAGLVLLLLQLLG